MNISPNRPPSLLRDIDFDSRCIEKVAEQIDYLIEDEIAAWFESGAIIDTDEPIHLEDEELDEYLDNRSAKLRAMILKCLVGNE